MRPSEYNIREGLSARTTSRECIRRQQRQWITKLISFPPQQQDAQYKSGLSAPAIAADLSARPKSYPQSVAEERTKNFWLGSRDFKNEISFLMMREVRGRRTMANEKGVNCSIIRPSLFHVAVILPVVRVRRAVPDVLFAKPTKLVVVSFFRTSFSRTQQSTVGKDWMQRPAK